MFDKKLQEIGLGKNQAEIYSLLISGGKKKGSELAKEVGLSRQLTYKVLDELMELGLVEKEKKSGSAGLFLPAHPSKLEELLFKKEAEIKRAQKELGATIDALTSQYNLTAGKPGVQFFEGEEGVRKVLEETLSVKDEIIYTIVDSQTLEKEIADIDQLYVQERIKKKIKKKIIMIDSPEARKYLEKNKNNKLTEIKIAPRGEIKNFYAVNQIYNQKVAYITFKNKSLTSSIISDPDIYKLNRFLFEALWESLS